MEQPNSTTEAMESRTAERLPAPCPTLCYLAVRVEVTLRWTNQIGRFFGSRDWNAIGFYRTIAMPLIPVPFTVFPNGPEWMNDLDARQWIVFENADGSLEVCLQCDDYKMGEGTKEDVEEAINEMLAAGWRRV